MHNLVCEFVKKIYMHPVHPGKKTCTKLFQHAHLLKLNFFHTHLYIYMVETYLHVTVGVGAWLQKFRLTLRLQIWFRLTVWWDDFRQDTRTTLNYQNNGTACMLDKKNRVYRDWEKTTCTRAPSIATVGCTGKNQGAFVRAGAHEFANCSRVSISIFS